MGAWSVGRLAVIRVSVEVSRPLERENRRDWRPPPPTPHEARVSAGLIPCAETKTKLVTPCDISLARVRLRFGFGFRVARGHHQLPRVA